MLSGDEELDLATRLREKNDLNAAKQLLLPHLRFVVRVARGYSGYGLALGDLIQEGNIGLMKAVKRFDPAMGVRLVSFAVHWIKAEIHEFILRNWRIVKVATTKAQRKLFFNLRKITKNITNFTEKNVQEIAHELNVNSEEVRLMHERLHAHDESFDSLESDDSEHRPWSPERYLEDQRYNPARQLEVKDWTENRESNLYQALLKLDARSQDILKRRWLANEKATLHELAADYNVSAERVRQIEKMAMDKLKLALVE